MTLQASSHLGCPWEDVLWVKAAIHFPPVRLMNGHFQILAGVVSVTNWHPGLWCWGVWDITIKGIVHSSVISLPYVLPQNQLTIPPYKNKSLLGPCLEDLSLPFASKPSLLNFLLSGERKKFLSVVIRGYQESLEIKLRTSAFYLAVSVCLSVCMCLCTYSQLTNEPLYKKLGHLEISSV